MIKGDYLDAILRSKNTVFTVPEICMLWGESSGQATRVRLNYYVKQKKLIRIRRGIYGKDKNYDRLELATKIFQPAYVSMETVLVKSGLIFQYYSGIYVVSYLNREVEIGGQKYHFRKIRNEILFNRAGIENSASTAERAILDVLYLNKDYYFDNLRSVDWDKVKNLLPIYQNKRMNNVVDKLIKEQKDDAGH